MFVHGSDIESNCKYDIGMMSRRAFVQARPLALENHQRKRALKHEALHCHDGYIKKLALSMIFRYGWSSYEFVIICISAISFYFTPIDQAQALSSSISL
jgi:hypothetical protein